MDLPRQCWKIERWNELSALPILAIVTEMQSMKAKLVEHLVTGSLDDDC